MDRELKSGETEQLHLAQSSWGCFGALSAIGTVTNSTAAEITDNTVKIEIGGDVGFSRHQADIATAKSAVIASIQ